MVLVDQLTKWWALSRLSSGPIRVIGTLDLELARNTGASFSLFQGKAFILVPVAVALVVVLGGRATLGDGRLSSLLQLLVGGGLGGAVLALAAVRLPLPEVADIVGAVRRRG